MLLHHTLEDLRENVDQKPVTVVSNVYCWYATVPRPAQPAAISEPNIQLAEGNEPAEPTEEINRKSHFPSDALRPTSYMFIYGSIFLWQKDFAFLGCGCWHNISLWENIVCCQTISERCWKFEIKITGFCSLKRYIVNFAVNKYHSPL